VQRACRGDDLLGTSYLKCFESWNVMGGCARRRAPAPKEIAATMTRLSMVDQEDVETARARIARWLGAGSMRFDGRRVTVEIIPRSLVQDIARSGSPAPTDIHGESISVDG
jgi:hypothetical protein